MVVVMVEVKVVKQKTKRRKKIVGWLLACLLNVPAT